MLGLNYSVSFKRSETPVNPSVPTDPKPLHANTLVSLNEVVYELFEVNR